MAIGEPTPFATSVTVAVAPPDPVATNVGWALPARKPPPNAIV